MYGTIEEATQALREAEMDCAADMGDEAVEQGWADLVHSVASCCPADVAAELLRRQGL